MIVQPNYLPASDREHASHSERHSLPDEGERHRGQKKVNPTAHHNISHCSEVLGQALRGGSARWRVMVPPHSAAPTPCCTPAKVSGGPADNGCRREGSWKGDGGGHCR